MLNAFLRWDSVFSNGRISFAYSHFSSEAPLRRRNKMFAMFAMFEMFAMFQIPRPVRIVDISTASIKHKVKFKPKVS